MTLTPGTRLSSYEILESIGAGGMGEVYKARDTKLGRDVAIKVLPEAFPENKERLARFEREARLLASLNHPNIATIHGLEESGGVHFLVLEFVPGETLAERIKRGAIPVDEALPLFKQIAEGLEAAHEKGVIHRDLKPANIKVTPEGKVKVLDFGLAKAFGEDVPVPDLSQSPTLTRDATRAGVILGTAAYMSPEQARGKAVDKRTDIWSFGCVLYEALAGRKAFQGETVTDTFAAIVKTEPDWKSLPENLPWRIRELLGRCLRKDRGLRLNDAGAARLDLVDALAEPSTGPAAAFPGMTQKRGIALFIATATTGALVASVILWGLMQPTQPPVRHLSVNLPVNGYLLQTKRSVATLSPDGKKIVYVAEGGQLFLRPIDRRQATLLPGTEGAQAPFFSPDSQWIGFYADRKLKKVSIAGGPPVSLVDSDWLHGTSWAPDGTIFITGRSDLGIQCVKDSGGKTEVMTTPDPEKGERKYFWPHVLPGGKALLFTVRSGGDLEDASIAVISLETGDKRILMNGTNPRYVPTGHIVFAQPESRLMAVPFDLAHLAITGSPFPVLEDVQISSMGEALFSISNDGSLLYVPGNSLSSLVWVDRQGSEQRLAEIPRPFLPHPRLSPDGRQLAVTVDDPSGVSFDIWILELARGTTTRLTFEGNNARPIWSPDGRLIIHNSDRVNNRYQVFSTPADGSGEAEQLTRGAYRVPTSLSSDGKTLVFRQYSYDSSWDIGMVRLEGERKPEMLLQTQFNEHTAMISPDDRWLAYVSDESGRDEIYIRSFPDVGSRVQISTEGGTEPMWSRDGRELFYRNGEKMMVVAASTALDFTPSKPMHLFEGVYVTGGFGGTPGVNYDVAPDGQRFLMVKSEEGSGSTQLHIILNWTEELKRLAPPN